MGNPALRDPVGEVWEFSEEDWTTSRCRIEEVRESGTLHMVDVDDGKPIPNQFIELDDLERDRRWTLVSGGGDSQ